MKFELSINSSQVLLLLLSLEDRRDKINSLYDSIEVVSASNNGIDEDLYYYLGSRYNNDLVEIDDLCSKLRKILCSIYRKD